MWIIINPIRFDDFNYYKHKLINISKIEKSL